MLGILILAQRSGTMPTTTGGGTTGMIVMWSMVAVCLLTIAGGWRWFSKAGQPGWAILVPIYNLFVMCRIAGRPAWWGILMLLPVINLVIAIMVCIDIARNYGKGAGYGLGLAFLPFPFWCMLGFGGAQYGDGGTDGRYATGDVHARDAA